MSPFRVNELRQQSERNITRYILHDCRLRNRAERRRPTAPTVKPVGAKQKTPFNRIVPRRGDKFKQGINENARNSNNRNRE